MTVYICGDSTAASYPAEDAPRMGWGQCLSEYIEGCEVVNCAAGGRSTKSFISEGRLVQIEEKLSAGDVMLIQFTHNDESPLVWRHTDEWTSFTHNLELFVDTARLYCATPVLMTGICLRSWKDGQLAESHGEYTDAVRALARRMNVPLIDMYALSRKLVEALGEEGSKKLFMHLEKGACPRYPEGMADDAHSSEEGARAFAQAIACEMKRLHLV